MRTYSKALEASRRTDDQNSYYDDPYNRTGDEPTFLQEMGFMTHEGFEALLNSHDVWSYDRDDPDVGFAAIALSRTAFSGQFSGGVASVLALAGNQSTFIVNGMVVHGTWHQGNEGPSTNDEIVVNGGRWSFTPVGFAPNYSGNVQYYGGDPSVSEAEKADILDRQTVNTDALKDAEGKLDAKEQVAVDRLNAIILKVSVMLSQLPPAGKLIAADGKIIPISELQQLWSRADFRLDSEGAATNNGYRNNGVGQAIRNNGDPLFVIDVGALYRYMGGSADLALHYVLHELMHVTLAGDQVSRNGGLHATTQNPVESWTSRMAQALATAGGMAYQPGWTPPGYPPRDWGPIGPATYQPPTPPAP